MCEMLEIILKVALLIGLFYIAWFDYKTGLIEVKWLLAFGICGIAGVLLKWDAAIMWQAVTGTLVGAVILMMAWISQESVGFGDGWLFVVTGIFLGFVQNFILFFGSILLAGIFSSVCLILKKKEKNDRVALAPFVLTAYVVFIL